MASQHQLPFERPIYELEEQLQKLESQPNPTANSKDIIRNMRVEITRMKREVFEHLDSWETVQVARHMDRPQTLDYIELVFDEFLELHGDKSFGDDRAIVTGLARIGAQRLMLVGQQKGRTLKERNECYYGCAHPEGYRKALAKMEMAAKFNLPIVCLIDTPGAYPGIGAEERGQAYNIAVNLREMSMLKTPIVCVVIGEGGSGGALGIGIGDHVAVLQFAYYSVISPEGCAAILWRDRERASDAADALRLSASHLLDLGVIDGVIEEPVGAAHRHPAAAIDAVRARILESLQELEGTPVERLLEQRYEKFRRMGTLFEAASPLEGEEQDPPAESTEGDAGPDETSGDDAGES